MIVQQGSLNTAAIVVPDLYVQIVPPQNQVINGVPTNVVGVVGTASWGPVNVPTIVGDFTSYVRAFGPVMARSYDMGTHVATAVLQGAGNFRCVRVTDGTETAATATVQTNCLTLTALYPGSLGANLSVTMGLGTRSGSYRATIAMSGTTAAGAVLPAFQPEVFDNIGGSGNAFWVALAAAINNGTGPLRGPSQLVVASAGAGTATPVSATTQLSGGADGSSASATFIGSDSVPRTGMYALRGQGCSIGVLADLTTTGTWTTQAAFGLSEGIYMVLTGASGETIATAASNKQASGLDSYACKLMIGDWLFWNDQTNNLPMRLVSPQGFVAGRLANLSPEQSSLNKPIYGVVGSQKSASVVGQNSVYSSGELQALFQWNIDVIANPQPGGTYWGCRLGHNSSSNAATCGDNYTRMTNFIAATLNAGMGVYVGQVINATLFQRIRATLLSFLQNLLGQGMLGTLDGSLPFGVICDTSNNPFSRTSLGYVQADCQVQYQAINEKFIVNLEGGQTVVVRRQTTPAGQAA